MAHKEKKANISMENISWKLIDKYFKDNPSNLVAHHLESYNDFFSGGINRIFKENNPIRFIEREDEEAKGQGQGQGLEHRDQCLLYLGGKNGDKIYFGKPIIYDDNYAHYMYPNDARLRNMTYGITIHYDVDVEFIYYVNDELKQHTMTLEQIYLGRFPIMLQTNLCILKGLSPEVRFNMGECRNDYGGYFIIDGKEKAIVSQEKFADNMLYIKKNKPDNTYSYSAEIRSVSEDASKPIRTTAVKMVAGPANFGLTKYSMGQLVVAVPNVRKPVPLFILMRALGVISDKSIIEYCLLDLEKNESYIDMFIPSIHDANKIFTQETALEFIALLTKRRTITGVWDILMNYFLPNVGEQNFLDKAYFIGYMVKRLLRVYNKEEKPTDRDSFRFKRVELTGSLIYDLFREYFLIQKRDIALKIDQEHYYHRGAYKEESFIKLIENNSREIFKERVVESGFRKAFKGNWGAEAHTKRVGAVQDLNRLSWNSFISQLRKINLPLDASAKVVGPRLLHSSQWGYIDPVDTPDGGNIGLHKHMAISTIITNGSSAKPLIKWLRAKTSLRLLQECNPQYLGATTKVLVNGVWIGVIDNPTETIKMLKLFRRNGLISVYTSISFNYESREIFIYTDAGRLSRPVYYIDGIGHGHGHGDGRDNKPSYDREDILTLINSGKFSWEEIIAGFKTKSDEGFYSKNNKIYDIHELYHSLHSIENVEEEFMKNKAVVDYIDTAEEEGALIATQLDDLKKSKYYTHLEIDPSLILGVLGNMVIFPENNPITRDAFSCGQSKQAVSVYHSNYQMRIDKMGVVLNYGQIPLVKSRYLKYINNEEQPYGVNAIVAIMSYTGYNVEDAILINEGSIKRGLFNTTYFSMYESREESTKVSGASTSSYFSNIESKNVGGIKPGYDYSHLDKYGLIKENTALDDKMVVIGKVTSDSAGSEKVRDASVFPKKGQLGFVDKAFITEGEEGFRLAKIRVREERIPAIGDKMASRAGQKGTIGLIIPECDMPFTADGLKPDMIINPHAIPSRMTIGQLVETLLGKVGVLYGGFGDCTAFANKGPNTEVYGEILVRAGYHSSGNQLLYNGMTGEQIYSEIYIGPTYYMRLKHMVKDKINYRARGPNTMLTRQSVQGRANDGGLRIGEMERDGILAHGCAGFLNESYLIRGDEYFMAVCNKTGSIAVYNKSMNLFLSPFSDGPIKFNTALDGKMNIQNVSRFGRSFSIVRVPYALKLLIQELQVMNVQMRIITEDNIDQLMSMSYSNNINKLLLDTDNTDLKLLMIQNRNKLKKNTEVGNPFEQAKETPEYNNFDSVTSPEYGTGSPAFQPSDSAEYNPESPQYNPGQETNSPVNSPDFLPPSSSPKLPSTEQSDLDSVGSSSVGSSSVGTSSVGSSSVGSSNMREADEQIKIKDPELKAKWESLPEGDKKILAEMIAKKKAEKAVIEPSTDLSFKPEPVEAQHMGGSILNIDEPAIEEGNSGNEEGNEGNNGDEGSGNSSGGSSTKSIAINL
uniref:DNA-directed RNA polymerase n=1 Tax=viral metagenome TaxID=1070528 RepID=A0A6C0HXI7_9ZZZZ